MARAKTLYETIIAEIDAESRLIEASLVGGGAADFPEYKERVGTVTGLARARRIVLETVRLQQEEEDTE